MGPSSNYIRDNLVELYESFCMRLNEVVRKVAIEQYIHGTVADALLSELASMKAQDEMYSALMARQRIPVSEWVANHS
jgi:hypothetical protein